MVAILTAFIISQSLAYAEINHEQFCKMAAEGGVRNLAFAPEHQMAFKNQGGILNQGLCWWHALFQRSAFYLTVFKPEDKPLNNFAALKLINRIARGDEVVEIPGFSNFKDFSAHYKDLILMQLEFWQREDIYINGDWWTGITGQTEVAPQEMRERMDKLYELVTVQDTIPFAMMQIPGIGTHAILFVRVKKLADGYKLWFVDNNEPGEVKKLVYKFGDRQLDFYGGSVPYIFRQHQIADFRQAATIFCSGRARFQE